MAVGQASAHVSGRSVEDEGRRVGAHRTKSCFMLLKVSRHRSRFSLNRATSLSSSCKRWCSAGCDIVSGLHPPAPARAGAASSLATLA